jgi:hypothetical protein
MDIWSRVGAGAMAPRFHVIEHFKAEGATRYETVTSAQFSISPALIAKFAASMPSAAYQESGLRCDGMGALPASRFSAPPSLGVTGLHGLSASRHPGT